MNTLHLLPVNDIATIEEDRALQESPACDLRPTARRRPTSSMRDGGGGQGRLQLGLTTLCTSRLRRVPTRPTPRGGRTREFADGAGHQRAGLRVVMDVVYNHTPASGRTRSQCSTGSCRATTSGSTDERGGGDVDVLSEHCGRARDDAEAHGRLAVTGRRSTRSTVPFRPDGTPPEVDDHGGPAALDQLTLAKDGVDGKKIYLYGEGWNFGRSPTTRGSCRQPAEHAAPEWAPSATGCATRFAAGARSTTTRGSRASQRALHRPNGAAANGLADRAAGPGCGTWRISSSWAWPAT
jgi:hypothetical protein